MTNIIRLVGEGAGYVADYRWTTYRFLLSNGNTIDVSAVTNDSWLSTEILKVVNGLDKLPDNYPKSLKVTIVGHVALAPPVEEEKVEEAPKPKQVRKRPAKKAATSVA